MTLDEYRKHPRRELFEQLSIADQITYVEEAPGWELILGSYPTKERILASATLFAEKGGSDAKSLMH